MAHPESHNRSMLIATFKNADRAQQAHDAVTDYGGYTDKSVSVLMSKKTRMEYFGEGERYETKKGTKAPEGAGIGGALGGTAGGIAGALAAVGSSVAIPGLGLVIAGPLAAALAGAGAGGGAGSLLGGLIGAGISEERAKRYKSDIEDGGVVLGVVPRNHEDADHFEHEWKDLGAERIYYESGGAWVLFKGKLLEAFDGLRSSELEDYRTDREGMETYIHNRTGTSQREVSQTIDEAASDMNYTFGTPATTGAAATGSTPESSSASAPSSAPTSPTSGAEASSATEPLATSEPQRSDAKSAVSPADEPARTSRPAAEERAPSPPATTSSAANDSASANEAEGSWRTFKGNLRESYGDLANDDVERHKGQREQLIGHVQEKTGAERSDVEEAIDRAASDSRYSFRPVDR